MKTHPTSKSIAHGLCAFAATAGTALAHPGDHSSTTESTGSGILHFVTQFDHIGPVIAALALGAVMLLRRTNRNRAD